MRTLVMVGALLACACSSGGAGSLEGADASTPHPDGGTPLPDGGSSGPLIMTTSGYDRTCTRDDECVLVSVGDVCGSCHCGRDAVAKSAETKYDADFAALRQQCPPQTGGVGCSCVYVPPPVCTGGQCTLAPTSHDAGTDG